MQNPQLIQNFLSQTGPVLQADDDELDEEEEGGDIVLTPEDEAAVNRVINECSI